VPDAAGGRESAARLRLAKIADERRRDLTLSAVRVFPSHQTWRDLMAGNPKKQSTYRQLEDALGWERGSVADVLDGGAPRVKPPPGADTSDAAAHLAEAGELIAGIAGLTDDERRLVLETLAVGRRRLRERRGNRIGERERGVDPRGRPGGMEGRA
jgi:hypothetical protein